MPTYINESNYMQMNRPRPYGRDHSGPRSNSNQLDQGLIDRHTSYGREAYELDCKQVLQHIQECPVCQHVFALKTPPTKIMSYGPGSSAPSINSPFSSLFQSTPSKIEISVSTLILLSVFLVIFFIYIIKTSRS